MVETLLDAHFVPLLLTRSSHPLLRRLARHVSAHLALSTSLSSLLGPLAIYQRARVEQRAEAKAKPVDSSQSGAFEGRGQGKRPGMERRVRAQEKHGEVGEYAVETIWL